jgi:hypothetical protein
VKFSDSSVEYDSTGTLTLPEENLYQRSTSELNDNFRLRQIHLLHSGRGEGKNCRRY